MQNKPNFQNAKNDYNLSKNNELQWTMNYELLLKTNPIKPNFTAALFGGNLCESVANFGSN